MGLMDWLLGKQEVTPAPVRPYLHQMPNWQALVPQCEQEIANFYGDLTRVTSELSTPVGPYHHTACEYAFAKAHGWVSTYSDFKRTYQDHPHMLEALRDEMARPFTPVVIHATNSSQVLAMQSGGAGLPSYPAPPQVGHRQAPGSAVRPTPPEQRPQQQHWGPRSG